MQSFTHSFIYTGIHTHKLGHTWENQNEKKQKKN